MRIAPPFRGAGLALAAAAGLIAPAAAGTLQINPVLVEIGEGRRSGSVTIANLEQVPVVIRAYALGWRQEGDDHYEDDAAMIVSPPVFTIPPGGTQVVRVGPRTPSGAPQAYRLIVEEVPEASPGAGIRVALRLNLPLYLNIGPGRPSDLAWNAQRGADGQWSVEARNGGRGWVRVDARAAVAATGLHFPEGFVFGTVLPGATRRWTVGPRLDLTDSSRFARIQAGSDDTHLASRGAR